MDVDVRRNLQSENLPDLDVICQSPTTSVNKEVFTSLKVLIPDRSSSLYLVEF